MISSEFTMSGDGFALLAGVLNLLTALLSCGFGVVTYVLHSMGLYTIAKRRQINHPWFAWVPILSLWLVGCVSDQYQYVVKGRNRAKRKSLLILSILSGVCALVFLACVVVGIVNAVGNDFYGAVLPVEVIVALVSWLVCLGLSVAITVIRYIALYDLYTSCAPQNNVLFLVLSILISLAEPIITFCIRNKDDGMPPRRVNPPVEEM